MEDLLKSAFLGTSQFPPPPCDSGVSADRLVLQMPGGMAANSVERQLLLRAGCQAIQTLAGTLPVQVPPFPPPPEESLKSPTPKLTQLLRQAFSAGAVNLLPEFLQCLGDTGIHLPHELLPLALELQDPARRRLLLPVLGERAGWLARFNPRWDWVLQTQRPLPDRLAAWEVEWNDSPFPRRLQALREVRQVEPAQAREWLRAVWTTEKADARRQLLEILQKNLSREDGPFLEACLQDRSEKVQAIARSLLLLVPDSSIELQLQNQADRIIQQFTGRLAPPSISGQPDLADISETVPLHRLVTSLRPSFWSQRLECSPRDVIRMLQNWNQDLRITDWVEALTRFQNLDSDAAAWQAACWEHGLRQVNEAPRPDDRLIQPLLALANVTDPETLSLVCENCLRQTALAVSLPMAALLSRLQTPWPASLSQTWLHFTRQLLKSRNDATASQWCETLLPAGLGLHPQVFSEVFHPWAVSSSTQGAIAAARLEQILKQFADLIRIRQTFLEEARRHSLTESVLKPTSGPQVPSFPQDENISGASKF
jgi:hypothetical protein